MKVSRVGPFCALVAVFFLAWSGPCAGEESSVPLAYRLYRYIKPVGIATYSSLWITFLLGLLKFKFRVQRIDMRWHYGFAILTVVLATLHLSLVELVRRM